MRNTSKLEEDVSCSTVVQAGVVGGDGDIFLTPSFGTKEQQLDGFNVVNIFFNGER